MSNINSTPATPVKITVADPSAIGLLGLAIVTLAASSQKLGFTDGTALLIPWALFLGACGQLYASVNDARLGNTFGATAFGGYAFFWFGMALSWITISSGVKCDVRQLGVVFVGYLIFTLFMTVGAAAVSKVLFFIFVAIDLLFIGLSLSNLAGSEFGHHLAGWSELAVSLLSFYACGAAVLNAHFGKTVLSVGKPFMQK